MVAHTHPSRGVIIAFHRDATVLSEWCPDGYAATERAIALIRSHAPLEANDTLIIMNVSGQEDSLPAFSRSSHYS